MTPLAYKLLIALFVSVAINTAYAIWHIGNASQKGRDTDPYAMIAVILLVITLILAVSVAVNAAHHFTWQ